MKRLKLSRKRWFNYYGGISGFFVIYPIILLMLCFGIYLYLEDGEISFMLFFVILFFLWTFWDLYQNLNFRELATKLSIEDSKEAARLVISALKWEIKIEEETIFEAINLVDKDIRNMNGEIIIIHFEKNKLLLKSIGNIDDDYIKPQSFTFGKNEENENNFMNFYKSYENSIRS